MNGETYRLLFHLVSIATDEYEKNKRAVMFYHQTRIADPNAKPMKPIEIKQPTRIILSPRFYELFLYDCQMSDRTPHDTFSGLHVTVDDRFGAGNLGVIVE